MPAVSHKKYPLADEGRAWDGAAARDRLYDHAGGDNNTDWPMYRKGFGWYDSSNEETKGAYKLPHHDVIGGEIQTVWNGVKAAGNAISGSRGGVDIPESDVASVKSHLEKHYHEFGKKAPWESENEADSDVEATSDVSDDADIVPVAKYWQIMRKSADSTPEILFYGEISQQGSWWGDDITPKAFADDIAKLGSVSHIKVRINSPGGDLFAANAIYNILKNHPAKITTYVDGLAASAASVVYMSGDERIIPRNGMIMIHNPSTVAWGDARDFRKVADTLDTARETIIAVYEQATGLDRAKIISLLNSETWITAKDAVDMGFAGKIDEQLAIAACIKDHSLIVNGLSFDASKFKNIPDAFAPRVEEIEDKVPPFSVFKDDALTRLELWCPFIDNGIRDDERMVFGYSTLFNVIDVDGHRMTRQAVEDALSDYSEFRNVRERHSLRAVGTAPVLDIDDIGLMTGVYISEGCEDVWKKCKDKTYKGFSLGGKILETTKAVVEGKLVVDLIKISIDEITLCDRPKCPGAVYQVVIRQGGAITLCSTGGGDNAMADEKKAQDEGVLAGLKTTILDWFKGEGKEEVAAALGIDVSNFATKSDIDGIKNSVGDLTIQIAALVSASEKPAEDPEAGGGKPAEETAVVQDSAAEATKVVAQFGEAMVALTNTLKDVSDRVGNLEDARGTRKSIDALGTGSVDDKEELWKGKVPGPRE
jgi:ATP-dependent protease ClpP protease subunit